MDGQISHFGNLTTRTIGIAMIMILFASLVKGAEPTGGTKESEELEVAIAKAVAAAKNGSPQNVDRSALKKHFLEKRALLPTAKGKGAKAAAVVCDNIGDVVICTDGESVCWWGPIHGYGCSF